jgi:hypothetical protein
MKKMLLDDEENPLWFALCDDRAPDDIKLHQW